MTLDKKTIKKILLIIVFSFIMLWITLNVNLVFTGIRFLFRVLLPFIIGLCIAFVLSVPLNKIEHKLKKKIKNKKIMRGISITITFLLFFLIIAFVFLLVIPDLVKTFESFGSKSPIIIEQITNWLENLLKDFPDLKKQIGQIDWNNVSNSIKDYFISNSSSILNNSIQFVKSFISGIYNIILGLIFSIYILFEKENLGTNLKKVFKAYFPKKATTKILEIQKTSASTFSKFISGQCLEAIILGVMIFITMTIFKIPYALSISVLTTITALVPIFGAFIAAFVGVILIGVNSITQAIFFVIIFLVAQQIDGNLIYPKVVGKSVGLPGIWVMLSVMIGGSLFGIIGMLVSVPISSILYSLLRDSVNNKIKKA